MKARLDKYARLVIKMGINLKENQLLVINAPIECADFARQIAEAAYKAGARDVIISWNDELFGKIRLDLAPEAVFDEFPEWRKLMYVGYAEQGAAFVSIAASDPELLKSVNPERVARTQKASNVALRDYRERLMKNRNQWCVVSVPTKSWAAKVFPNDPADKALRKLWNAILQTVRVDDITDAVQRWTEHLAALNRHKNFLQEQNFRYLKFKNSRGTDLTVELPKGHIWISGADETPEGHSFIANMPTEEVFTLPKRNGVNGKVVSAKPLQYNGKLIEDFALTFREGKVVAYTARKGQEVLQKLLEMDECASYLGEVALVPYDSPISKLDILFYNTLFDENASCHLAFGKAYPTCIEGGGMMTPEELSAAGVNDSLIHEDFMIGTPDMDIVGVTWDGQEVDVFVHGNFAYSKG